MPVCRTNPTSGCALPTELYGTPYIFIPHTSSWQPHQPTATTAEPIRTIGLAIRILYYSFYMLRLFRNHSAFNSHNFPRPYTTTYLSSMLLWHSNHYAPTRGALRFGTYLVASGCTHGLDTVSFHSICIEVSFAAVSAQGFARASPPFGGSRCHHRYGLLATHLAIVYSVYSAYLPGLHSARPSAFAEGGGFEPPRFSAHGPMPLLPLSSQPTFLVFVLCVAILSRHHFSILSSLILPSAIICLISLSGYNHSLDATCRPFSSHSTRVRLNIWP